MQHHPSQSQRPMQPADPMEVPQQMTNVQPVPDMAQRAHQTQGQPQFTQQEQQQIMQMAESMAQNVTPEQVNNGQRMVMSIPTPGHGDPASVSSTSRHKSGWWWNVGDDAAGVACTLLGVTFWIIVLPVFPRRPMGTMLAIETVSPRATMIYT